MKNKKNHFLKSLTILLLSITAISCGNDDEPAAPAPADYFFKAKVDGLQYETDAAFRVLASSDAADISISSVLADGRNFTLEIVDPTGVGTYQYPVPVGSDYIINMEYGDASASTALWRTGACTGTTGTINITALSATEISGTFSFVGKRTSFCSDPAKNITEGSFKSGLIQ